MNKKAYLQKRTELLNEAKDLLKNGDIKGAEEKKAEIEKLDEKFDAEAKMQANLDALEGKNIDNVLLSGKPEKVGLTEEEEKPITDKYSSKEYCQAFMNYIAKGEKMPKEFSNESSTTTSTTAGVLVPTITYNKIVVELEKVGSIYSKVFKTAYPAGLVIPTSSVKPVASWPDEDKGAETQKYDTDKITFTGYKLEAKVAFSLFMTETAYDIFEAQFIQQVKDAVIKAIDKAIIAGTGVGQPKGILTETAAATVNIAKTANLTYAKLCECESEVPSAYDSGTVWIMSKKSFFAWMGITDNNGQPIARVNAGLDGKPSYTLLGREVVLADGYIENYADTVTKDTTFAVLYDLGNYILNEVMGMRIVRYSDNDNDNTILKVVMLLDGKSVDNRSLVKVVKKSA